MKRFARVDKALRAVDHVGAYLGPLALRCLLAIEFGSAGLEKWRGENWFADIQHRFPFPLNELPVEFSWHLATGMELIGAVGLLLGVAVRFVTAGFIFLTVVAVAAVHWPDQWSTLADLLQGYVITDKGYGNYKLPVIYLAMLLPLLLQGGGKASLDHLWFRRAGCKGSAASN